MIATSYNDIMSAIDSVDPVLYGKTRNYINGHVTRLSPYISRGIISTKQVASAVLARGYKLYETETFLKELAWRDYFQNVWVAVGDGIDGDVKQPQPNAAHCNYLPHSILNACTGITAIDENIKSFYDSGYMHNHCRMYVASMVCNLAKCHWLTPARWMYYYLLDADWASNALSWQWVAGSFSSKLYFANQENINKYCGTLQRGTFLDTGYNSLEVMPVPQALQQLDSCNLVTALPETPLPLINESLPTYIYNFYNLDPSWDKHINANRILLLEPSFFTRYPVSPKTIDFVIAAAQNIQGLQVYTGEFSMICGFAGASNLNFKEHPTNRHYIGTEHARDWLFPAVKGYYASFSAYWKDCNKFVDGYYK